MERFDGELDLLGPEWSVADLIDHLLHRGVCVKGNVTISIAGIDLMTLGLQLVFASTATLRRRAKEAA
ncbi:MAG: hypothetical protein AUH85_12465 [Chloroflexi bacterium 13_1_40CM_4_68_4]|nr:MAG: hypothetical protein AUH85_12465 [Chloroflexi bacterium 13_1_40CM_4_68_4]